MGAPESFETAYQTTLPQHVKAELAARQEQVMVVRDEHPLLVGFDLIWPYVKAPVIGFLLLALALGIVPAWKATAGKWMRR